MTAVEFFTYCAGLGTLLVSAATTIRLLRQPTTRNNPPRWEQVPDPTNPAVDGLTLRLREVQQARYASPIVRRTLSPSAGPVRRIAASATRSQPTTFGTRIPKKEG